MWGTGSHWAAGYRIVSAVCAAAISLHRGKAGGLLSVAHLGTGVVTKMSGLDFMLLNAFTIHAYDMRYSS